MNPILHRIVQRDSLSRVEAAQLLRDILDEKIPDLLLAALLVALASKGETVDEIAGFIDTMRERMTRVSLQVEAVDGCGTGGDGTGTFNISTAASLMAAAAGVPVAKHGNRAVSSSCGSADVLEALGYKFPTESSTASRNLHTDDFVFLFAPTFHPAMARVRGVRAELGVRTIFNLLGPLSNPANVRHQVIGVYSRGLLEKIGEVAVATGSGRLLIVHSADGMDEFSISASTLVREWTGQYWREYQFTPEDAGLGRADRATIAGGSATINSRLVRRALSGEVGPVTDVTILNAAALLYVHGQADSIQDAVSMLKEVSLTGKIRERSEAIFESSRRAV